MFKPTDQFLQCYNSQWINSVNMHQFLNLNVRSNREHQQEEPTYSFITAKPRLQDVLF